MKKTIFLIVSLALAGALCWDYRAGRELAEKTRLATEDERRVARLESELARVKRRAQADVQRQEQTVEGLRQRLAAEKSSLDTAQQRLETARNRGLPGNDYTAGIEFRLRQSRDALQELDAQIKSAKAQELELSGQGRLAQDQQRLGNRQDQLNLEARIRQQQLLLLDTESQLKQLRAQGQLEPETRAQLKQLGQQASDQRLELQNLKAMRPQLAVQGNEAVNSLGGQVLDQRTGLRLTREQLEARYRQVKAVGADLEKQLAEARGDVNGQKKALVLLQTEAQAERDKTGALRAQLKQEEERLQNLLNN